MDRRSFVTGLAVGGAVGAGAASLLIKPKEVIKEVEVVKEVAAPAIAQERIEIAMVSTWPRDFPGLGTGAQRFAQKLSDVSDGRIQVTYYAAGERVGAFDSFDEVASGNAQAYHAADYYWKGKHPGWAYFTAVPFGLTYPEMKAWLRWMGGQELHDELAGEFGLKCVPMGNTGVQWGGWFNKEINSADDLKGLKMRIPGLGGDVMAKLGASPVSLPGGQIYENLVSGSIDATEWVGPYNDYFMKFYEAAKYYYYPGFHEPGGGVSMGMNAKWWADLTKWERAVITTCSMEEHAAQYEEAQANNGAYLARLVKDHGVQLKEFGDDVYEAFGDASKAVFDETRQHSAMADKVTTDYQAKLREVGGWQKIAEIGFSNLRNDALGI